MKFLIVLLPFLVQFGLAQTWQTININNYSNLPLMYWENGDSYMPRMQHFKINSFDNSIWGVSKSRVFRLNNSGQFMLWDENNVSNFYSGDYYIDLAFQLDKTFLLSYNTGLYQFDGTSWGLLSGLDNGQNLSTDSDTLWITRAGSPFQIYFSNMLTSGFTGGPIRIASKNGILFNSGGNYSGSLVNLSNSTIYIYHMNTDPYYLGAQNYDFKFSPYSDTFFTSGNRGFSLAVNGNFVDTITKYNTTNMPDLAITEFEFDSQGNIWALFSPPAPSSLILPEKIGYLDRSSNTWSQIYDGSNSPIDFSNHRVTIEVDTNDNLWVANGQNLHLLKLGYVPQWLGNSELNQKITSVTVFPNPSAGKIQISATFPIHQIVVNDLLGKEILKTNSVKEINLPKGVYVMSVFGANGEIVREKVVVE